jgi:hypothetical protein
MIICFLVGSQMKPLAWDRAYDMFLGNCYITPRGTLIDEFEAMEE